MDGLKLRRAMDSDSEFAFLVKKSAFKQYIEHIWGWDEEEQRRLHERRFVSQNYRVIEVMNVDVGILAFVRESGCLRLNQIFILPEHQGRGIGGACVRVMIEEASAANLPIRLQVLKVNKHAQGFFEHLGFERIDESDTHIIMERS